MGRSGCLAAEIRRIFPRCRQFGAIAWQQSLGIRRVRPDDDQLRSADRQRQVHRALAALLRAEFGWSVGPENIAITGGGQTAFFFLFNLLAGEFQGGKRKAILLPLVPEYIGYMNQGLSPGLFRAVEPRLEVLSGHRFKYHVDFDRIIVDDDVAAICVSRPTNPSGNVLTNEEVHRLASIARNAGVPLIIDNAYGLPFPGILFRSADPIWDDNIILTLSLSKLGLPNTRTGIVVAQPEIIQAHRLDDGDRRTS